VWKKFANLESRVNLCSYKDAQENLKMLKAKEVKKGSELEKEIALMSNKIENAIIIQEKIRKKSLLKKRIFIFISILIVAVFMAYCTFRGYY
jgi:hypothetical protein